MIIGGKYKIESDSTQVILSEHSIISDNTRGPKKAKTENIGKDKWGNIGYYANLPNALWGLSQHDLNKSGLATIEQVLAKLDELIAMISKVTSIPVDLLPFNRAATQTPRLESSTPTVELDVLTPLTPRVKRILSAEHLAKLREGRERARLMNPPKSKVVRRKRK